MTHAVEVRSITDFARIAPRSHRGRAHIVGKHRDRNKFKVMPSGERVDNAEFHRLQNMTDDLLTDTYATVGTRLLAAVPVQVRRKLQTYLAKEARYGEQERKHNSYLATLLRLIAPRRGMTPMQLLKTIEQDPSFGLNLLIDH